MCNHADIHYMCRHVKIAIRQNCDKPDNCGSKKTIAKLSRNCDRCLRYEEEDKKFGYGEVVFREVRW